jgi:PPOX class probable F420-dependent enzyme
MSVEIPESHRDLIEGPIYSVFTTVTSSGSPMNTVMWCSYDGEHVLVNTRGYSQKIKNIKANPKVALIAVDPENPYRWIDVRGTVEEVVPDEDFNNINAHAKLYRGVDEYYGGVSPIELKGKEDRVVIKMRPLKVFAFPPKGR